MHVPIYYVYLCVRTRILDTRLEKYIYDTEYQFLNSCLTEIFILKWFNFDLRIPVLFSSITYTSQALKYDFVEGKCPDSNVCIPIESWNNAPALWNIDGITVLYLFCMS